MRDNEDVERWFIAQGLPHAIHNYSASTDVWTRAAPSLSLIFLLEATASFGDRFTGWAQAGVFIAAVALLLGAVVVVNTLRGRARLALPDDVGILEIALFVLGPPVLRLIFGGDGRGFLLLAGLNIVILGVVYFTVSFGMIPMFKTAASHMVREIGGVDRLMLRSLPLLLLFATFLFLNAEIWQVAHDFTPVFYAVSVGFVSVLALAFLAFRIPSETASLAGFTSWSEVCEAADSCDAPIDTDGRTWLVEPPSPLPLERADRLNIGMLLFMRQAVQVLLVALVIGAFYVAFGLFTVRRETILVWTAATEESFSAEAILETTLAGAEVTLTWELLAVSGFIAAFSALQFAVSLITDATYRDEFFTEAAGEIRSVLAVRALYLDDIDRADHPTS